MKTFKEILNEATMTPEEKLEAQERKKKDVAELAGKKRALDAAAEFKVGDRVVVKEVDLGDFRWKKVGDSRFKTSKFSSYQTKYLKDLTVVGIHYGESGGYTPTGDGVGEYKNVNPCYILSYTGGHPDKYGWTSDSEGKFECLIFERDLRDVGKEEETAKIFDDLVEEVAKTVGCKNFEIKKDREGKIEHVSFQKYWVKLSTNPTLNMNSYYGHDSRNKSGKTGHLYEIYLGEFFSREEAEDFAEEARKLYSNKDFAKKKLKTSSGKDTTITVGPDMAKDYGRNEYTMNKEQFLEIAKGVIDMDEFKKNHRGSIAGKSLGIV